MRLCASAVVLSLMAILLVINLNLAFHFTSIYLCSRKSNHFLYYTYNSRFGSIVNHRILLYACSADHSESKVNSDGDVDDISNDASINETLISQGITFDDLIQGRKAVLDAISKAKNNTSIAATLVKDPLGRAALEIFDEEKRLEKSMKNAEKSRAIKEAKKLAKSQNLIPTPPRPIEKKKPLVKPAPLRKNKLQTIGRLKSFIKSSENKSMRMDVAPMETNVDIESHTEPRQRIASTTRRSTAASSKVNDNVSTMNIDGETPWKRSPPKTRVTKKTSTGKAETKSTDAFKPNRQNQPDLDDILK